MLDPCVLKNHPALGDIEPVALAALGAGTMRFISRFCRRTFESTDYDVLLQGTNTRSLFLPEYPVTKIVVRSDRIPAVQVINDSPTAQAATVEVRAGGLRLELTENGITTGWSLVWPDFPTLGAMSAAVNLLGSGWRAILSPRFAGWKSEDLKPYVGVRSARQLVVSLEPHWHYLSDFRLVPETGEVVRGSGWWGGTWAYRVQYTAGYEALPDDLILAAVELAGATQTALRTDPTMQSESLGQYSYTRATQLGWEAISLVSRSTVQSYRKTTIPYFKA